MFSKRSQAKRQAQTGRITFAPKVSRDDARVEFNKHCALEIFARFQAIRHQEKIHCLLESGTKVQLLAILDPRLHHVTSMSVEQFQQLAGTLMSGQHPHLKTRLGPTGCDVS